MDNTNTKNPAEAPTEKSVVTGKGHIQFEMNKSFTCPKCGEMVPAFDKKPGYCVKCALHIVK